MGSKSNKSSVTPVNLRCEYLENPLGVDTTQPRFSWILESQTRGEYQTAYRILVASDREKLDKDDGDKWDSSKMDSDRSVNVAYEGKARGVTRSIRQLPSTSARGGGDRHRRWLCTVLRRNKRQSSRPRGAPNPLARAPCSGDGHGANRPVAQASRITPFEQTWRSRPDNSIFCIWGLRSDLPERARPESSAARGRRPLGTPM